MNVLHIISDQHQAACMGCEGHGQALTPNLDRLAGEGMRFANAYAQNPICTPSRMSIYTGQYCHNHGFFGLSGERPQGMQSFLGHFKQHGYKTAVIGKTHVPNEPRDWLLDHVDLWASCTSGPTASSSPSPYRRYLQALGLAHDDDNLKITGYPPHPTGLPQNQLRARPTKLPLEHNVESWCVQQATDFIDQRGDQPFCVQVSLPKPHAAYTPHRRFWDMYDDDLELSPTFYQDPKGRPPHFRQMHEMFRGVWDSADEVLSYEEAARNIWRGYLGCVSQVDYSVGLLLEYLQENGLAEDTLVVYNADHGAYSTCFGIQEKAPGICSEMVCRVPTIWRVPGTTVAGGVCDELVENIDMTPTIMALCGVPAMADMDGVDLSGLLRGEGGPVKDMAVTEHRHSKALRWGPWRYVHYQPGDFGGNYGELYQLEDDPFEANNLFDDPAHRDIVVEGERRLLEWLVGTRHVRNTFSGGRFEDNYL